MKWTNQEHYGYYNNNPWHHFAYRSHVQVNDSGSSKSQKGVVTEDAEDGVCTNGVEVGGAERHGEQLAVSTRWCCGVNQGVGVGSNRSLVSGKFDRRYIHSNCQII